MSKSLLEQVNRLVHNLDNDKIDFDVHAKSSASNVKTLLHALNNKNTFLLGLLERVKAALEEELKSTEFYIDLFEKAPCGYLVLNNKGIIIKANACATEQLGLDKYPVVNYAFSRFVADAHINIYLEIKRSLLKGEPITREVELQSYAQQSTFHALVDASIIDNSDENAPILFRFIINNIDNIKSLNKELHEQQEAFKTLAFTDAITGLSNRRSFENRIRDMIKQFDEGDPAQKGFFLCYVDLDGFKLINDSLGHDMGDEVLKIIATRLKNSLRPADMIARIGGDEFAILTNIQNRQFEMTTIADSILSAVSNRIKLANNTEIFVTASLGFAQYGYDANTLEGLINCADTALRASKQMGKNRYTRFEHQTKATAKAQLQLTNHLHRAIKAEHFELHLQPQFTVDSKVPKSYEALLRLKDQKTDRLLTPEEFLPLAHQAGLIRPISDWVIKEACRILSLMAEHSLNNTIIVPKLSINLPANAQELMHYKEKICNNLDKYALHPSWLEVELTEGLLLDMDSPEARKALYMLDKLGISIALDDFGTGFSCMAYLKSLPLNKIKIDKKFIKEICSDRNDRAIVKAIIDMGHALNLKVLAEGVETQDQYEQLNDLGCDEIQGYHLGPPEPYHQIIKALENVQTGTIAPTV